MTDTERMHGPNWQKWIGHLAGKESHGLEIGTFKGESAEMACKLIFNHPKSTYTCVDTFKGSIEHAINKIDCTTLEQDWTRRLAPYSQARKIKGLSNEVMRSLAGSYDFIYIDAAHDAMNVLRDSVLAWDLLAVGGVIIWDDYQWTDMPNPLDRPKMAIDYFMGCFVRQIEVIGKVWQVAIRKTA